MIDQDDERPLPPSLDPRAGLGLSKSRSARRRTPGWVHALRVICGVLSVVMLAATGYATVIVNRANSASGNLASTEDDANSNRLGNVDDINMLIVGNDSRAGYTQEELDKISSASEDGLNTDTIMLVHVPANGTKVSVISFPRDSWVEIPGYGENRINAAYANGYIDMPDSATEAERRANGQKTLIATVSQLTGLQIDNYVEVTLLGFYDLTNALGGIEVNMCQASEDPTGNSGADFPAGVQTLDGTQALSFVRQRHGLPNGDLDRIKRQQYFFGAVIRKVLDQGLLDLANFNKLTGIIDALSGTISYDANLDPLTFAEQMQNIAAGNVSFYTLPLAAQPEVRIDGKDVLQVADDKELEAFFTSLSDDPSSPATSSAPPKTIDPAEVTLDVYNGTGVEGLGETAAGALINMGFNVENTLTALTTDYPTSVVQYPAGMADEANTVAAAVTGATVEESDQVDKVILIIGANYPGAGGDSGAPTSTEAPQTQQSSTAADAGCIN